MKKIAIFVSGTGTNMDAIYKNIEKNILKNISIGIVISDKKNALALKKAKKYKIDTWFIDPKEYKCKKDYEKAIIKQLKAKQIDLIVLAGFMRILSPYIIKQYKNKIINIHPSLLPAFKGAHGIRDAYNYGVKVGGVTVHYVTEELDSGQIIMQKAFELSKRETISSYERKIHKIEYEIYSKAIQTVLKNKL